MRAVLTALLLLPLAAQAQQQAATPVCSGRVEMRDLRPQPAEDGTPRRMFVDLVNVSSETLVVQPTVRAGREPVFASPVLLRRSETRTVSLPVGDEMPLVMTPAALRSVIGASCRIG
jgi:hypothetical protein